MKSRRDFLKGAAAGAAAGAVTRPLNEEAHAQERVETTTALPPDARTAALETGSEDFYTEEERERYFVDEPVSDYMVDVLRSLDIDYMAIQCAASFRGLQESIINYGGNTRPEIITCLHEESAAAIGHGYSKVAGKPMAMLAHSTVGFQHAAMAVYNAWCDRVPLIVFGGNYRSFDDRRPLVNWIHTAQDPVKVLRDFTKWDDAPSSPQHFAESTVRAYKIAITPPMGPVVIDLDHDLMEASMEGNRLPIPRLARTSPPQGDTGAVREAAKLLVEAENPVIVVDRLAHTPEGMYGLVKLAELLQVPVLDRGGRMNMPNVHYLNQTGRNSLLADADVILGLELTDFWGVLRQMRDVVHPDVIRRANPDAKLIHIGVGDLYLKSNYQDFQRYQPVDLSIAGDAEATLPSLTEAVLEAMSRRRRSQIGEREEGWRKAHAEIRRSARQQAAIGWDASPVSTARLTMELWRAVKDDDWSLATEASFLQFWPTRLWEIDRHHQWTGGSGGYGVGYYAPASAGIALANKEKGRMSVCIQPDGDLMFAPGVLWTAAHHGLPLLSVMHNNRAYHQEIMHVQRMALRRNRGVDGQAKIGNALEDPEINYADLAKSMGVWSSGPIQDPSDLASALARAADVVRQGEPALVDVVCQPR